MEKIKVLELFAGSRSIGNTAEELGMEVFSVDWTPYERIDLAIDIEELKKRTSSIHSKYCMGFS